MTDAAHWSYTLRMTFYSNADEVRDDISESELPDEELEKYWRDASPPFPSGYYLPAAQRPCDLGSRWDVV